MSRHFLLLAATATLMNGYGRGALAQDGASTTSPSAPAAKPATRPSRGEFPGMGFGGAVKLPAGIAVEANVAYVADGGHRNQVVDIYYPEQAPAKPLPLMIWVHGGAWLGGTQANPPCLFLLSRGYAVASIQHRMSGDAKWPAQAYDVKAAIRFLRANAAKYHVDPDRFGIGGDSSGGHLAALVGTSGDVKELEGELGSAGVSSRVQAVVDWFGPTDFTLMDQQNGGKGLQHNSPRSPESMLLGGAIQDHKDAAKSANPITYVDRGDPPFLIMHGDNDQLVPLGQSTILATALLEAGVEVTMKTIPGAAHEGPEFRAAASQRQMEAFLNLHLKPADPLSTESR